MPNATRDDSWRASGRPVSTIARSFSAALDEAFFMKPDLDNLSQSVAQKQQSVSTQKSELEELEARLRETEARLKTQQASDSSSSSSITSPAQPRTRGDNRNDNNNNNNSARSRNALDRAFDPPLDTQRNAKSPLPPTGQENTPPQAQMSRNEGIGPRTKNF